MQACFSSWALWVGMIYAIDAILDVSYLELGRLVLFICSYIATLEKKSEKVR